MAHTGSPDIVDQAMVEAGRLRQTHFPLASDEAWRRERLFRYLYSREHREHPPINLVGSWTPEDLDRELQRWRDYVKRDMTEEEVLDVLTLEMEDWYQKSWSEALEEGTSPLLASVAMPVWNASVGVLVPQSLGPLRIVRAESYDDDTSLGCSYNYKSTESGQTLTLTIYSNNLANVRDGVADPRTAEHFYCCIQALAVHFESNGDQQVPDSAQGPGVEVLVDGQGREIAFGSYYVEVRSSAGIVRGEALSIRGFRGGLLKVRYTRRGLRDPDAEKHPGLDTVNRDLANFVGLFG